MTCGPGRGLNQIQTAFCSQPIREQQLTCDSIYTCLFVKYIQFEAVLLWVSFLRSWRVHVGGVDQGQLRARLWGRGWADLQQGEWIPVHQTPVRPRKSGFFQRKGRKRVKEWREVTFMKEWVKALYIGDHQALDLPQNLFPFPRTGHLKISLGPTQLLYSKFHRWAVNYFLSPSCALGISLGLKYPYCHFFIWFYGPIID